MQRRGTLVRFAYISGAVACRSRQTLDLAQFKCEACRIRSRFVEPLLPRAAGCFGALNNTLVALARAVRPLAAGEPQQARHRLLRHRRGLSVLRRPAHCRFVPEEGSKLARVQTLSLREEELGHQRQTTGGLVQSCHAHASRWPCGVPQRRAARAVQASASPMPGALARLATASPNAK